MTIYNKIEKTNKNKLQNSKIFGFWLYILSDSILFATLFSVYIILKDSTVHGPSGKDIFNFYIIFIETCLLLSSSITYNNVLKFMKKNNKNLVNIWMFITFLFGFTFCLIEIYEFQTLIKENHGPEKSAFLSAFFTLIGTHGVHVIAGLIWIVIMILHIQRLGLTEKNQIRLQCLSLFWHFLDIIWICVFTSVYLIGIL